MVRIIFLDIDGVICCNHKMNLEASKLERLRAIILHTGSNVVISSNWRNYPKLLEKLLITLKLYNIPCLGCTPNIATTDSMNRPKEINSWIRTWQKEKKTFITKYIAIDDRYLLSEEGGGSLKNRFVQTSFPQGLTHERAQEAIRLLGDSKYKPVVEQISKIPRVYCRNKHGRFIPMLESLSSSV